MSSSRESIPRDDPPVSVAQRLRRAHTQILPRVMRSVIVFKGELGTAKVPASYDSFCADARAQDLERTGRIFGRAAFGRLLRGSFGYLKQDHD